MRLREMPGFLAALSAARVRRPDLPIKAFRAAAETERPGLARLRVSPALVIRWAEFHALALERAA